MIARPLRELKNSQKNALVITAHPDDESVFMGGTIAEFKKWRWRVLCITDCDKRYNNRRRKELLSASRIYRKGGTQITPFMLEVCKKRGRFQEGEIARKIKDFIRRHPKPGIVFTHNRYGEYGHKTHKLVNKVVKSSGLRNIYTFSFATTPRNGRTKLEIVRLSKRSVSIKKRAIRMYLGGSQKTNLSRMRNMVDWALETKEERFNKIIKIL